jgi:hypothetical protein
MGSNFLDQLNQLVDIGEHGLFLFLFEPFQRLGNPGPCKIGFDYPSFSIKSFRHLSSLSSVFDVLRQNPSAVKIIFMVLQVIFLVPQTIAAITLLPANHEELRGN